jgi:hypothetical protein
MDVNTLQLFVGLAFIFVVGWLLLGKKKTTETTVESTPAAPATTEAPSAELVNEAPVVEAPAEKPAKAKRTPAKKPAAAKKAPAKKPAAKRAPAKKTTK